MAILIGNNQIKLDSGQTVNAQQGGWFDGRQFWGGTLSNPGQINPQSNQQGAGTAVSKEVIAQTNPNNVAYVNQQRANLGLTPAPTVQNPTPVPQEQVVAPQFDTGAAGGQGGNTPTNPAGSPGGSGFPSAPITPLNAGSSPDLSGFGGNTPTLNLPDLYKSLQDSSGISKIEMDLESKAKDYADAQSKINDNPWLSESDRVGRIQKLSTDYNNEVKNVQDSLAMKKADIQTQLDLQTKQFDINSNIAKQALDEFNTLLSSGALSGATGNDIAQITRATGISSSEIQAAINATADKNVSTSVQTVDDGTNIYSVVLNNKTGQIISKQVLAGSKPNTTATNGTASQQYTQGLKQNAQDQQNQYQDWVAQDAKNGATLQQLIGNYSKAGGLTVDQIYSIYNSNSKYGQAKETLAQAKQGVFANQPPPKAATPAKKPFSIFGLPLTL